MKQGILFLLCIVSHIEIQAQSFLGFLTDNYSGVNSVTLNPANSVDSRYHIDINVGGLSGFLANNYYSLQRSDLFEDTLNLTETNVEFDVSQIRMSGNVDIIGPSILFNINKKHAISVITRGRVFYNLTDVNTTTYSIFSNNFSNEIDVPIREGNFTITSNAWAEIGISYATVLFENKTHFLKGGLTLKYLQGLGNNYATGKDINLNYNANSTVLIDGSTTGSLSSEGEFSYGYNENFDQGFKGLNSLKLNSDATGIGADIGLIYEWRPKYKNYRDQDVYGYETAHRNRNKYLLKFGISLTDFGSIDYKEGIEEIYDIETTINEDQYESVANFKDKLDFFYDRIETRETPKSNLPTALHINVDWNLNEKFYLNLNTDFSITDTKKENTNSIANLVTATPRYESKWFSMYSPISIPQNSGVQWGAGFRLGPIYAGSGSIISSLLNKNTKIADFYVGLKIPLYQSEPKDTDKDGVLDKDDECPNTRGKRNNKGCPWRDSDKDGVLDKDDQCPNVYGLVSNGGCPVKEIDETIQKELNSYARTILFDYGKATIKEESILVLDEIVKIFNEYPNTKFVIEGHTDSSGSNILNLKMSIKRAESVQNYFIEQGIDASRLSAKGYGEEQPITTNKTKKGRARNRRVEINLKN